MSNTESSYASMNDIYIMLQGGDIAYIPLELYSAPENVVESVNNNGTFEKKFFLNDEGVFPANLSGPAVTKVIEWNIENEDGSIKEFDSSQDLGAPKPGFFIDLRKLGMARTNMIKTRDVSGFTTDTAIPNQDLRIPSTPFIGVPEDKLYQLKGNPKNYGLYVGFFENTESERNNFDCFSYRISYISPEVLKNSICTEEELHKISISHLKSYYGDARVQSGAVNPLDFGMQVSDDGRIIPPFSFMMLACFIANLTTFE
ncbi:hypothetical protein GV054_11660 [Marinomonas mediterranea]|uniref:hypothetical protein n=1 Tax=Marinomonas mediterranea TaxID=119864 RepID=UPI00234A711B|nr:hypothetical protein [Marinomonas mediterranea]WCN13610.1 hypothetical protein GV054_11660 [Marinomonas mediterranea]